MRKSILCVLMAALGLALVSCTALDTQAATPAKPIQAETASTEGSEEQERYLILFSNMRIRDIQELQGFFNAVDYLGRNNAAERRDYLAGYGDALLSDCYDSAYSALVETFSQETMWEVLGENLCAAFSREGEARRSFIEQVRGNTIAPSLMDAKSDFHALMPKVQDAYKEILPYSVAMIRISGSEEEEARYCNALEKFAALLEEATALLQADED